MSTDIYGGSINDPFTHTSIPALRLSYSLHLHSKILLDTNKMDAQQKTLRLYTNYNVIN